MSYNKFNENDIILLKKEYYNSNRCKIKDVIFNKGTLDADYYNIEDYPKSDGSSRWINMSSAHACYVLDIKTLRKLKINKINGV
jgi:hypothetical protein